VIAVLGEYYPWIKAAHVIFVIFWMAGLFMLPRFYAYHQEARSGTSEWKVWEEREARLIRIILNPALVIVWLLGITLLLITGVGQEGWFHVKFLAAGLLVLYHLWMVGYAKRLSEGGKLVSSRTMRLLNEVPGITAIIIVIMVIVRPF
jgi:putative membrane protein